MRTATILVMLISAVVFLVVGPACQETGPPQPDKSADLSVAGTWKFESLVMTSAEGDVFYPYGETFYGRLMYDAEGHMSFLAMRPGRPKFASGDIYRGTPEEIKAAFENFDAYCGTYHLDREQQTITHRIEACRFPNWEGTRQVRGYEFSEGKLILTATLFARDREWQARAVLSRLD